MTFDAATALDTAKTAYIANADYAAEKSTTKALAFQTACEQLRLLLPKITGRGGHGGTSVEFNVEGLQAAIEKVDRWLGASSDSDRSDTSAPPRAISLANFRD